LGAARIGGGDRARPARLRSDTGRRRPRADVIRRASPQLVASANLSAVGLLAALVLGRPEIVALAAPFLVALGAGLVLAAAPRFTAGLTAAQERVVEGDPVDVRLEIAAAA